MDARLLRSQLCKPSLGEYVRETVTTNHIEGAFGHFKRAVAGVYHQVSDEHIDRYLGMFAWHLNRRQMTSGQRIEELLKACVGRRITHKQLIREHLDGFTLPCKKG